MKIDLEKFICSLGMQCYCSFFDTIKFSDIQKALADQGLEYKDGNITENEPKKEWYIASCNIGKCITSRGTDTYLFLKGERTTKEKVFKVIPNMSSSVFHQSFRPATEEEISGEFEWNGDQFVLKKDTSKKEQTELSKCLVDELDKEYKRGYRQGIEDGKKWIENNALYACGFLDKFKQDMEQNLKERQL